MQPADTAIVPSETPSSAQTELEIHTKKIPRQRHFLALFFLSFTWGAFGVDRFYMGLVGTGILKLITFGGFGFWTLIDLFVIMTGTFKDKQGRLTLQVGEYKKFAIRTVLWFAIILGAVILINGIILILGAYQIITAFQDGNLPSIPGLDALTGGSSEQKSQINDLLGQ